MIDAPPTPCLIIDEQVVDRNLAAIAAYAAEHQLKLRPHTKTHKSLRMAAKQIHSGAIGLTVAKVGEAQVLASACDDLLIAYPALDPPRTTRIAELAQQHNILVAIDSAVAANALSAAAASAHSNINILVELDVGMKRTGVQTPTDALDLAHLIDTTPHLHLRGLMFYPGHIRQPPDQQQTPMRAISAMLAETLDQWNRHGFDASIVSGGSTPTALQSHLIPELTEIRPGTYIYYDMNCVRGGYCALEDCAAKIEATVVSNAVPNQIILDSGSKTLTSDLCGPAPDSGFGFLPQFPDARIIKLTEEHAQVDVSRCENRPQLAQRVQVIPNHICVCVNMQNTAYLRRAGGALEPLPIDTRGLLS